jgi:hypothetical protein
MSNPQNLLGRIKDWSRKNNHSWHESFQAGLTEQDIRKQLERIAPYTLPEEFISLYTLHNGQKDAIDEFKEITAYRDRGEAYLEVPASMFPVFGFEGSYLLVECGEQASGSLYYYFIEDPDGPYLWHESLDAMLGCTLECFESGAYFVAIDGALEGKRSLENEIRLKHSPNAFSFSEDEDSGAEILPASLAALKSQLQSSDIRERRAAAGSILSTKATDAEYIECFEIALRDEDLWVRNQAVNGIARGKDRFVVLAPQVSAQLDTVFEQENQTEQLSLGEWLNQQLEQRNIPMTLPNDFSEPELAGMLLRIAMNPSSIDLAEEYLLAFSEVLTSAAQELAMTRQTSVSADQVLQLRRIAAYCLGKLGDASFVPVLEKAARESDVHLAEYAKRAIEKLTK